MKSQKLKTFKATIGAGSSKGKSVLIPALATTRSSKSILRESLFNTLQFDLLDHPFVEVFAGSGIVALEAVSRGASHAWCIEKNRSVYDLLCENIRHIAPDRVSAVWGDSFNDFGRVYHEATAGGVRAFFYFDPPFSIREGMEEIYEKTLRLLASIEAERCAMAIVEHMTQVDLPERIGALQLHKKRRFGKSSLSYYQAAKTDEA